MALSDLTPVAQDYLKVIWSRTEWGEPPITAGELADRFGTSSAAVTDTARRLAQQGLVDYVPYRPLRLTPAGEEAAVAMVRRHRLLETYLVRALGYTWTEVHDEAERLEHAVSDQLIDRIDVALGHPREDPHGDPIPDAAGRTERPAGAVLLDRAKGAGRYRVLRVSDADPATLDAARELGLLPGRPLELIGIDPAVLADGRRVDAQLARGIWVRPIGTESPRGPSGDGSA